MLGAVVLAAAGAAPFAQLVWAEGGGAPTVAPNRITQLRVCGNNVVPFPGSQCARDERGAPITAKELDCSVRVYVGAARAVFAASVTYEGQLQYSFHERLRQGWHRELIGVYVHATEMPGGRYACNLSLGRTHGSVSFRSGGAFAPVVGPAVCRTSHTKDHACTADESSTAIPAGTPSVTCTGVFPRLEGARVEIDFLRLDADGTETVLQRTTDTLPYPIVEEWASLPRAWAAGQYACRYFVNGTVAAEKRFTVA
jgi:hypothetical protein